MVQLLSLSWHYTIALSIFKFVPDFQIPVGLSIAVTWISAITMITQPAEVYLFGMVVGWYCFAMLIPKLIHCLFYIPLVHGLKLSSIYEVSFRCSFVDLP